VKVPPVSTPKRYDGCNSFVFLEADPIVLTIDSVHDLVCEANPMFGQLDEKSLSMVSGVSVQVSENRDQKTENSMPPILCRLFSVLCPLYFPDTRHLKS
jgi:hypothetical protein